MFVLNEASGKEEGAGIIHENVQLVSSLVHACSLSRGSVNVRARTTYFRFRNAPEDERVQAPLGWVAEALIHEYLLQPV